MRRWVSSGNVCSGVDIFVLSSCIFSVHCTSMHAATIFKHSRCGEPDSQENTLDVDELDVGLY